MKKKIEDKEKSQEEPPMSPQEKLGRALIERDERNEFYRFLGRLGNFLSKPVRRWGRRF